jgi:ArsR family transcriptional regulator
MRPGIRTVHYRMSSLKEGEPRHHPVRGERPTDRAHRGRASRMPGLPDPKSGNEGAILIIKGGSAWHPGRSWRSSESARVPAGLGLRAGGALTGARCVGIVLGGTKMVSGDLVYRFKVLSVESRVSILQLLAKRSLCVGALSRRLGISPGAVSQHLRILREAGLVFSDRRGYYLHYRVNPGILASWVAGLSRWLDSFGAEAAGGPRQAEQPPCAARKRSALPQRVRGKPQACSTGHMKKCDGNKRNHCCGRDRRGQR